MRDLTKKIAILRAHIPCSVSMKNTIGVSKTSILFQKKRSPVYTGEFWTTRQRQGNNLHEIAYRACFKPALPAYFINRYTKKGDIVYDPFSGRGTTIIEAALSGRNVVANDINPISKILSEGRLYIPDLQQLEARIDLIQKQKIKNEEHQLQMFYHKNTFLEILQLRQWLNKRKLNHSEDALDKWIRMVATNRLTGHSPGFFSVYTLPPNQAVTRERQKKINLKRNQKPDYRNVKNLIIKKTKSLIKDLTKPELKNLENASINALFLSKSSSATKEIQSNSIQLTITSPPFLDIIQYSKDNWLRCWFNDLDAETIQKNITMSKTIENWVLIMQKVFDELYRITKIGGYLAFEVGEVRDGKIKLEEYVLPMGVNAGFTCKHVIINAHQFTKTANIWGIKNNVNGTNSNRIVVFEKK